MNTTTENTNHRFESAMKFFIQCGSDEPTARQKAAAYVTKKATRITVFSSTAGILFLEQMQSTASF